MKFKFFSSSYSEIKTDTHDLDHLKKQINDPNTSYAISPFEENLFRECVTVKNKFLNIEHFVHVGIGGSHLGPEMLTKALQTSDVQFHFINNIDPDEIHSTLSKIEFQKSIFYFVSKSGGTAETIAALIILINHFKQRGIEEVEIFKRFVFATDPEKSELLTLAHTYDISTLTVPSSVGGRFSVLTPVGFFPALFAGINVREMLEGAQQLRDQMLASSDTDLFKTVQFLFELKKREQRSMTVFMPYSSKLRELSFWFTQLWAESLGKEKNLEGKTVKDGFTPIPAYGATDQHSQVQLFMEGPEDKVLIVLGLEHFNHDFKLTNSINSPAFVRLKDSKLSDLMKAELIGTLEALEAKSRPYIYIQLPQLDAYFLGQLIMFFEMLTGLMGTKMRIDPFNQPGVEAGKINSYAWLSKLK